MPIQRIPQQSVNSLVSLSSIFSTSAVVKELIDNSIDAEARDIKIEVDGETGGLKYCAVRDNGGGVYKDDRDLMCCNCTTSKLSNTVANMKSGLLSEISTLGFRGEALFFISQLIQLDPPKGCMTIISKSKEEQMGEQWNISGSGEVSGVKRLVAAEVGTTIKLTGLFSSFVVRQRILMKQSSRQIDEIRHLIIAYSLTYPQLRFSLRIVDVIQSTGKISQSLTNLKRNLSLSATSKRASLLSQICKIRNMNKSFFEGRFSDDDDFDSPIKFNAQYTLPIMTGNTEVSTVKSSHMFLSVNGRPIDKTTSSLFKSVFNILKTIYANMNLLKPSVWSLSIEVTNPRDLDVNIEPLKNDVMVYKQDQFTESLQTILTKLVQDAHGFAIDLNSNHTNCPEQEDQLESSTFTVSNDIGKESLNDEYNQEANDNLRSEDEMHIATKEPHESPKLFVPSTVENISDEDEDDWCFNTHRTFSQDLDKNVNDNHNDENEFINEDLMLSNDITLSNPFVYSKITRSNKDMDDSSTTSFVPDTTSDTNATSLLPDTTYDLTTTEHITVVPSKIKDILTGNSKRKSQMPITKFISKEHQSARSGASKKLTDFTESTLNFTVKVKDLSITAVNGDLDDDDYIFGDENTEVNVKLTSWYSEIGEKLTVGKGDLIVVSGNNAGNVLKLEYR